MRQKEEERLTWSEWIAPKRQPLAACTKRRTHTTAQSEAGTGDNPSRRARMSRPQRQTRARKSRQEHAVTTCWYSHGA